MRRVWEWIAANKLLFGIQIVVITALIIGTRADHRPRVLAALIGLVLLGWVLHVFYHQWSLWLESIFWPVQVRRPDDRHTLVPIAVNRVGDNEFTDAESLMIKLWLGMQRRSMLDNPIVRLVLMILAIFLFVVIMGSLLQRFGPIESLAMTIALFAAIGYVIGRHRRIQTALQEFLLLRAIGRCGSCGYDLKLLQPHSDGCAVCSECGAAWRWHDQHDLLDQLLTARNIRPKKAQPSANRP